MKRGTWIEYPISVACGCHGGRRIARWQARLTWQPPEAWPEGARLLVC
jgi:hypothetical protein